MKNDVKLLKFKRSPVKVKKYGNVTVKDIRIYEKLVYKNSKLKLDINFLKNCKQLFFVSEIRYL